MKKLGVRDHFQTLQDFNRRQNTRDIPSQLSRSGFEGTDALFFCIQLSKIDSGCFEAAQHEDILHEAWPVLTGEAKLYFVFQLINENFRFNFGSGFATDAFISALSTPRVLEKDNCGKQLLLKLNHIDLYFVLYWLEFLEELGHEIDDVFGQSLLDYVTENHNLLHS